MRALGFDLPVTPSPALLMRFTAPPGLVHSLVAAPRIEVREAGDGQLLVAADYRGEVDERDLRCTGEEMLRRLSATFAGADEVRLDSVRLGTRPMPVDGLPIIGPIPGVSGAFVAVMHSAVTLAPAAALLLAAEIVQGVQAAEFAGVRPERFMPMPQADAARAGGGRH